MASDLGVSNVGLSRFTKHVHSFLMVLMLAISLPVLQARAEQPVETFTLDNGMDVVVITDNRAPVVTHMVWYRVGAADEPRGVSGIAHFLEHLMFKSTEKIPMGEFSKIVARLGGQDNAFTSQDATAYFQRISKDRLADVMAMEADRMVNLRLTEKEVLTERNVILEERRSRIENNPSSLLAEQMDAALYLAHPYGIPIIGWMHEMAELSPQDAMDFYKQHYAPNNAILVVAGDVSAADVREDGGGHLRQGRPQRCGGRRAPPRERAASPEPAQAGTEGPARGQAVGFPLLSRAQLQECRAGRGRSA